MIHIHRKTILFRLCMCVCVCNHLAWSWDIDCSTHIWKVFDFIRNYSMSINIDAISTRKQFYDEFLNMDLTIQIWSFKWRNQSQLDMNLIELENCFSAFNCILLANWKQHFHIYLNNEDSFRHWLWMDRFN